MATDPAPRFHHQQEIFFKLTGSASPACEFFPANTHSTPRPATRNITFSPDVSRNSMDNFSSRVVKSVPRMNHDTGFSIEWSIDEQYKLEEGLARHANEVNVVRYIKIAASLPEKTVRDVALRCKWMGRKRRKQENLKFGKFTHRKELELGTSTNNGISSAASVNGFSLATNIHPQCDFMLSGVMSGASRNLLEENNQAFSQISANLSSHKLQQNIHLFVRTKNNLSEILSEMRNTPGLMSQMAPLPIHLNEELASRILLPITQPMVFSSSLVTCLKQEPGC